MAKKEIYDQEEIDKLVQERLQEYQQLHVARIILVNGNTYISYGIRNYITEQAMYHLFKLLELMKVEYRTNIPMEGESLFIVIDGEDADRAAFIQKFIDNGYKLSWK